MVLHHVSTDPAGWRDVRAAAETDDDDGAGAGARLEAAAAHAGGYGDTARRCATLSCWRNAGSQRAQVHRLDSMAPVRPRERRRRGTCTLAADIHSNLHTLKLNKKNPFHAKNLYNVH